MINKPNKVILNFSSFYEMYCWDMPTILAHMGCCPLHPRWGGKPQLLVFWDPSQTASLFSFSSRRLHGERSTFKARCRRRWH